MSIDLTKPIWRKRDKTPATVLKVYENGNVVIEYEAHACLGAMSFTQTEVSALFENTPTEPQYCWLAILERQDGQRFVEPCQSEQSAQSIRRPGAKFIGICKVPLVPDGEDV